MGKYSDINAYVKNCFFEQRRSEIMNIEDRAERKQQIRENMYLFDSDVEPPKTSQTFTVGTKCGGFIVNAKGEILS